MNIYNLANSFPIWICCTFTVSIVFIQSFLYFKLAKKHSISMGADAHDCSKAFKVGVISAIGPGIACFIALLGLMTTIGGPLAWLRLSVIGAAPTELAAVSAATNSMGIPGAVLGDKLYNLNALSVTWWTLALNGCGWLVFCALFADKLDIMREKVGKGDTIWLGVLSTSAMLGIFAYFSINSFVYKFSIKIPELLAVIGSALAMYTCIMLSKKYRFLKEYSLGVAIICGIAFGLGSSFL